MKAWYLSVESDPDQGTYVVFANTRNEARSQADSHDLFYDSWIDITARRAKNYDGLEKLSKEELDLKLWHDGWRWFDYDTPWPEEVTDEEFLEWYRKNIW